MKPPAFAYERPTSLEGALAALARHGDDAKVLAGGQSLIAMLNLRLLAPKTIIDAGRLSELDYTREDAGELRIGALTRHNTVMRSAEVAQHCTPESFNDGKLLVRTDSTAWATQLRLLAPTVVRRLNQELGHGTVTLIEVAGPHLPNWKKGPRSVRDGRGPRDTYG